MEIQVLLPRLGESVTEGTVTRWLKKEGDRVEADEPLLEVSTDKVDTEIPSPATGVLSAIRVQEDETVEVGAELATIDDGAGGESSPPEACAREQSEPAAPSAPSPVAPAAATPEPRPASPVSPLVRRLAAEGGLEVSALTGTGLRGRLRAADVRTAATARAAAPGVTPLVRRTAAELGVDLDALTGSGIGGRLRRRDVLQAAGTSPARDPQAPPRQEARPLAPDGDSATSSRGRTVPMSRLRKVIAQRMVESLHTTAQLTTVVEVDVTKVARLRARAKDAFADRHGVPLSFLPFFALAAVEALAAHPVVNASLDAEGEQVTFHDRVHLGIAVDTDRGLLVPVLKDAGDLNLAGLARRIAEAAERTRSGRAGADELTGGTFTLTNTGSRGALFDTPILNAPQVAIVGTGAVVKRPVVVDSPELGEIVSIRSMAYLSLTYDHRVVDGADAARFLVSVQRRLEGGDFAAELGLVEGN